jgi:hypothetical protein
MRFIKVNPVLDTEEIDLRTYEGFCRDRDFEFDEMLYWPIYINVSRIKYFELEHYVTEPNTLIYVDYQNEYIEVHETPEEIIELIEQAK